MQRGKLLSCDARPAQLIFSGREKFRPQMGTDETQIKPMGLNWLRIVFLARI
jgi:hypothetical protein